MEYSNWINKSIEDTDKVSISPIWGFYDVLDIELNAPKIGDIIPLGSHWCFFHPHVPMAKVGKDGHPKRGSFMPDPNGLPRRMFAGSNIIFKNNIKIGDSVKRIQTIKSIKEKNGKSGKLLFVNLEEEYFVDGTLCITQLNDIVYREPPIKPNKDSPVSKSKELPLEIPASQFKKEIFPNPVMLFKYSAITFNGHRIHYDREYAVFEEGYPGLVVHGPLTATLLMHFCIESFNGNLKEFKFKALKPLFDVETFNLNAQKNNETGTIELYATNMNNEICMAASAKI